MIYGILARMTTSLRSTGSRDALLAAARRVLRERGLHGIRVRDVAAAAGMSPGAVMYHYRTTDDLLLAVHQDTQSRYLALRTEAAASIGNGDAWSRLCSAFKIGLPPYSDGDLIELLYEMHGLTRRSPRHAILLTELWNAELTLYRELIDAGVDQGLFRVDDPTSVARALLALEDGIALHLVSDNEAMSSAVAMVTFTQVAATLLGNPKLYEPERTRR